MSEDIFDREIRKSQGVVDADGDKSKSMRVFSRAGKDDSILNITTTPAKKRTSATLIDDSDEEKIQPDTKKSRRGSLGADGRNINIIYKDTFSNIFSKDYCHLPDRCEHRLLLDKTERIQ